MNYLQSQVKFINNNNEESFYHYLRRSINTCTSFSFSVAFISDSGLQLIIRELRDSSHKNIRGQILTTNYEYGTTPNALKMLLSLDNVECKVYDALPNGVRKFHTKGYLFEYPDRYEVIIGSSNMTQFALKSNHEWNISYISKNDPTISEILDAYELLFNHKQSKPLNSNFIDDYSKEYYNRKYLSSYKQDLYNKMVEFIKDNPANVFFTQIAELFEVDELSLIEKIELENDNDIKPNEMQELALEGLANIRSSGGNKGLIIAATGTGKTYLAAFDVLQFNPARVLFVVHRERILQDAMKTFKRIIPGKKYGFITGQHKDLEADYIFASVQTISKDDNINYFNKAHFDYIVLDEAHRSAAPSYNKIINYFQPKFLLGMTATPERTDQNNIFELYDNQIAVEIRLREALEKNLVVPFHYFGITDVTSDLSDIDLSKDIDILADRLNIKSRVDLIIENIELYKHSGEKTKALGFCVNRKHAKYMSDNFNDRGLSAIYLTGESSADEREIAVKRLEDNLDLLSFIFTVEIFNEGVDIPSANMVLMLRPTQSPIIFTQQLGRGLRLHRGKEYLTVLDFIGNYNKSFLIPIALSGDNAYDKDDIILSTQNDFFDIPGDTFITIEEKTKRQILEQLERVNFNQTSYLKESYMSVRKSLSSFAFLTNFPFNGFDPIRFIKKESSYLSFIARVEKNDFTIKNLNEDSLKMSYIKFIDSLLPINRIYEFGILKDLIKHKNGNLDDLFLKMKRYIDNPCRADFDHAIRLLEQEFMSITEIKKYGLCIENSNQIIKLTDQFEIILQDEFFYDIINDSLNYGISRYIHEYGRTVDNFPASRLYMAYPKKDIFTLARYDKNVSGALMSGVFRIDKDYFFTVNLHKHNVSDSIDYKDHFIDRKNFQWQSQNSRSQTSNDGINIINHKELGYNLHLYVRKTATENADKAGFSEKFIYLGKVDVKSFEGNKPITFQLKLQNEVPLDIYQKLTKHYRKNDENE